MYKPARVIITPEIILIQSEYFIMALKSIFDIKKAMMSMVNEETSCEKSHVNNTVIYITG
jgi:hypothetical protein